MKLKFILFLLIGFTLESCSKDRIPILAEITTLPVTNIGVNFATSGSYVVNNTLFMEITENGICWSKSKNPTINDFKQSSSNTYVTIIDGILENNFQMVELDKGTQYYVRAYAKIGENLIYGEQLSFTTTTEYFTEQGLFIDERDGMEYKWVTIDGTTWMAENLKYAGELVFGENEAYVYGYTGELDNAGWPIDYDYQYAIALENYKTYGLIYGDALDISCPQGWRVPTVDQWRRLVNYSGGSQNAGRLLKSQGTDLWTAPNEATNDTMFSVLPGGTLSRFDFYDFSGLGATTSFWASEKNGNPFSDFIISFRNDDNLSIQDARYFNTGYCRCVKDE